MAISNRSLSWIYDRLQSASDLVPFLQPSQPIQLPLRSPSSHRSQTEKSFESVRRIFALKRSSSDTQQQQQSYSVSKRPIRTNHALLTALLILATLTLMLTAIRSAMGAYGPEQRAKALMLASLNERASFAQNTMGEERRNALMASRPRYLVRDWSLRLGFNNMRFIIETALLHARLLGRTLVLPSYLYARGCEDGTKCTKYWQEINQREALSNNKWVPGIRGKTDESVWVIPIGMMIDLNELQNRFGPIILTSDYVKAYSLERQATERRDGDWDPISFAVPGLSYQAIERSDFLNSSFIRVDDLAPLPVKLRAGKGPLPKFSPLLVPVSFTAKLILDTLLKHFDEAQDSASFKPPIKLSEFIDRLPQDMRSTISSNCVRLHESGDASLGAVIKGEAMVGYVTGKDAEVELVKRWLEVLLEKKRSFVLLRTFADRTDAFLAKPTQRIEYSLALQSRLRGFVDDYGSIDADVLHLKGEFHDVIKAGALYFSSMIEQAKFTKIILNDVTVDAQVHLIADVLDAKMRARCGGRQWMAAHMRRADFPPDWVVSPNIKTHLQRIKARLAEGLNFLQLASSFEAYPGGPDQGRVLYPLPKKTDPFYVATDERDTASLLEVKNAGGVTLADLLTKEDRLALGESALLTDWLGLIERSLLARSAFFFGARLSSLTGGVINERVTLGKGWDTIATE